MAGWGFRSVQLGLLRSGLVPTKLQKGLVGGQSGLSTEAVRATLCSGVGIGRRSEHHVHRHHVHSRHKKKKDTAVLERGKGGSTAYGAMAEGVSVAEDVYTSTYFSLTEGEVENFVRRRKLDYKNSPDNVTLKECPFCPPHKGQRDNTYKISVNKENGCFNCFRCRTKGNWWTLRKKFVGDGVDSMLSSFRGVDRSVSTKLDTKDRKETIPPEKDERERQRIIFAQSKEMQDFLRNERGLSDEVVTKYKVTGTNHKTFENGKAVQKQCLTFWMCDKNHQFVRYKLRDIKDKSSQLLLPKGGAWGIFGLHTIDKNDKEVILTEGEFDAMAAYQGTGIPAVSLPNGASALPVEVLPCLEQFEKIYLWMDDDQPGREGAQDFARKLGYSRCFNVKTRGGENVGPKDANDALRQGVDMKELIRKAGKPQNQSIVRLEDIMSEVYEEWKNPSKSEGVPWTSFPALNEIVKGHRRGELSLVSGHTGIGKTTFLGQMSLDLCMSGVRTLWGSFEINNVRMAKMLLSQFYFMKTERYLRPKDIASFDHFREICAEFEALPIYFMRFFGSCPVSKVIETMEYANYIMDTTHYVLDNLQFMLSGQARGSHKFDLQDEAIIEFRKFATSNNAHISLVMHPRKENDEELIQTSSISGSAKATQEADNILLLQRGERGPFLEIRKNRYDGALGRIPLVFDSESKTFAQSTRTSSEIPKFSPRESYDSPMQRSKKPSWLNDIVPMQMHVPKEQIRLNEMEADTELNSLVDNVVEDSHAKTRKVGGRQS